MHCNPVRVFNFKRKKTLRTARLQIQKIILRIIYNIYRRKGELSIYLRKHNWAGDWIRAQNRSLLLLRTDRRTSSASSDASSPPPSLTESEGLSACD